MSIRKEKLEDIKPLRNQVKVRVIPPSEIVRPSGIILAPKARDAAFKEISTYEVEILELGPGVVNRKNNQTLFDVGDICLTDKFAGTVIPTEGDLIIKVIPESMLLARKSNGAEALDPSKLEALYDRVVLIEELPETTTESGIIIEGGDASSIFDTERLKSVSRWGAILMIRLSVSISKSSFV